MSSNKFQKDVIYNENISNVLRLCRKDALVLKVKTKGSKEEPRATSSILEQNIAKPRYSVRKTMCI